MTPYMFEDVYFISGGEDVYYMILRHENIYVLYICCPFQSAGCSPIATPQGRAKGAGAEVSPDFPELLLEPMHSPGTLLIIFNDHAAKK